jgi:glycosidase
MKAVYQLILCCSMILFLSCNTPSNNSKKEGSEKPKITMDGHVPNWSKDMNMYEVNIRQFTPEGTFLAFEKHIPRLKDMGVDILWLMPIYPISETKKKGTLGSYYAVSDFTKVNPEFGTLKEFQQMVKTIHENDMKIILDFVPNHTGWDHVWIEEHPEYYSQDKDGNIVDPIDPSTGKSWGWTDVADLNFDNKEMRKHMISDMIHWIKNEEIDGYRMDVAHGVPVNFWSEVSTALTEVKEDVFMLAESEVPELRNEKYFQVDYGWELHHVMNAVAKGEKGPADIKSWYEENKKKYKLGWHIQFTSNHDENSWAGTTEERMGKAHDALAALAFTLEGMPLIYGGQEEPLKRRLEFFEKDDIGFGVYSKADWFTKILKAKKDNEALWSGAYGGDVEFLQSTEEILVYKRAKNENEVIVILNLSDKASSTELNFDAAEYKSVFDGKSFNLKKGEKLNLEPWSYFVLSNNK